MTEIMFMVVSVMATIAVLGVVDMRSKTNVELAKARVAEREAEVKLARLNLQKQGLDDGRLSVVSAEGAVVGAVVDA